MRISDWSSDVCSSDLVWSGLLNLTCIMKKGRLLLIPVPMGEAPIENSMVPALGEAIADMWALLVETESTARRFITAMGIQPPLEELKLRVDGKNAKDTGTGVDTYLRPGLAGSDQG